jgi:hypothetical protein
MPGADFWAFDGMRPPACPAWAHHNYFRKALIAKADALTNSGPL